MDNGTTAQSIVPVPRCPVAVRTATLDDASFIDQLQKVHSHMVGWFPRKQMEQYIEGEHVLIAEESPSPPGRGVRGEGASDHQACDATPHPSPLPTPGQGEGVKPLGYIIFKDQYLKRDDVGIIYQLNVLPLKQRNLIGATLVKEAFARAAYGCKLFSCWCAQDIQANWFWESIGFVPLAFRTGSRGKQRIHIFWQRRIREEDTGPGATPWWFPYQTQAGAVREDRLVLPIPPETHWRDVMPLVLPEQEDPHPGPLPEGEGDMPKTLPGGAPVRLRPDKPRLTRHQRAALARAQSSHLGAAPIGKKAVIRCGRIKYVDIPGFDPAVDGPDELLEEAERQAETKRRRAASRKPRAKHDPKLIQQARELRDRYLEAVNERGLLPQTWDADGAKYDVSRALGSDDEIRVRPEEVRLLDAA